MTRKHSVDGDASTLKQKLDRITERVEQKQKHKEEALQADGYGPEVITAIEKEAESIKQDRTKTAGDDPRESKGKGARGVSPIRVIEKGQLSLLEGEMRGDYTQVPINASTEHPTIFTRIGLFAPTQRGTALQELDEDLAWHFKTGWGRGRKFGSPLTIYDEDTLLALGALRQIQLRGKGKKMPVEVMNPFEPGGETSVDVLYTTIGEIQRYLKQAKGGRGNKKRLASIKRLASVTIEFTKISDPKTNRAIKAETFSTKIIDLLTEEMSNDSVLYVQFPPVMVKWLHESFTYIDMEIRRQLRGDTAKAIHRHLSSQKKFNIGAVAFREVLHYTRELKHFTAALRDAMQQLEALGWCEYDIRGNGRTEPHVLTGRRL